MSVRSVEEARAALAGGADLIDVKEPSRGALGMADTDVIAAIIDAVQAKRPVSAALGEWVDREQSELPSGLAYVKWGLARLASSLTFALLQMARFPHGPKPVLVAYADHKRAMSPDPIVLSRAVCDRSFHFSALLIDTAIKDGTTLLDWLEPAALARIRFQLADAGVPLALAGSLSSDAIRWLAPLAPDWFAVRGAACDGGRNGVVSEAKVRELKSVIDDAQSGERRPEHGQ